MTVDWTLAGLIGAPLTELYVDETKISKQGFDALVDLIKRCNTLKILRFSIHDYYGFKDSEETDLSPLLQAVSESTSIQSFYFSRYGQKMKEKELTAVVNFFRETKSLKTFDSDRFPLPDGFDTGGFVDSLEKAFYANPIMRQFDFDDEESFSEFLSKDSGDRVYDNLRAAHLVKVGRTLISAAKICGKVIPIEMIETILRQYTADSSWSDENWRVIRRAVMDRGTIGKLRSNEEFIVQELLYICQKF